MLNEQVKQVYNILFIVIICGLLIMLYNGITLKCPDAKEGWMVYRQGPYGTVGTGATDPIGFYTYPQYRKPYNWPIGFKTTYPIEHIAPVWNTTWL